MYTRSEVEWSSVNQLRRWILMSCANANPCWTFGVTCDLGHVGLDSGPELPPSFIQKHASNETRSLLSYNTGTPHVVLTHAYVHKIPLKQHFICPDTLPPVRYTERLSPPAVT